MYMGGPKFCVDEPRTTHNYMAGCLCQEVPVTLAQMRLTFTDPQNN